MLVEVVAGETTVITGTYTSTTGHLRVNIWPADAREAGAQWSIDGSEWFDSGVWVGGLEPGEYVVYFKEAADWIKPADKLVEVVANEWTTISGHYTSTKGYLRVYIFPAEATEAGAKWSIDGSEWFDSAAIIGGVEPGDCVVYFKEVAGWDEPANKTVEVVAGILNTTTGTYYPRESTTGSLKVFIEPAGAREAGAKWRIDGSEWFQSGTIHDGLEPGEYVVYFKEVEGWDKPVNKTVEVVAGETTTTTGTYYPLEQTTGNLKVFIEPAGAREAGAKWRIDDSEWFQSGTIHDGLVPGEYVVYFKEVAGWNKPVNKTVEVVAGETRTVTGTYSNGQETGNLQVFIHPTEAREAGARWRIDGSEWFQSGTIHDGLEPGEYVVYFKEVEGWDKPVNKTVEVVTGETTTVTGTYSNGQETGNLQVFIHPAEAGEDGAMWRKGNHEWRRSGEAYEGLQPGNYEVSFKAIEGWDEPAGVVAQVRSGETTEVSVEYLRRPSALPVIHYFTATPHVIGEGSTALLEWYVENATSVTIDHDIGEVNSEEGRYEVQPRGTTTYTLTATNEAGSKTARVTVKVGEDPVIHWFTSSNPGENPITVGQSAILGWYVTGADSCRISWEAASAPGHNAVDPIEGTLKVSPEVTTVYKLKAANEVGTATATAVVAVTKAPSIVRFTACPESILPGRSTTLSWYVFGDAVVEITPSLGIEPGNEGSAEVVLDESTEFVLVARNSHGEDEAAVEVRVVDDPAELSASLVTTSAPGKSKPAPSGRVGVETSFQVEVENSGSGAAKDFYVRLFDRETVVDEMKLDKLRSGQKTRVTLSYMPLRKGKRKLKVVADSENDIPELDEGNNKDSFRYKVQSVTGPDLLITDVKIEQAPAGAPSGALLVSFSIVNVGSKKSKAFQYHAWLQSVSSDRARANDILVADGYIRSLNPGKRVGISRIVKMDVFWKKFFFRGVVDVHGAVGEQSEDNNVEVVKFKKCNIK